jgi:hypothetical protein
MFIDGGLAITLRPIVNGKALSLVTSGERSMNLSPQYLKEKNVS